MSKKLALAMVFAGALFSGPTSAFAGEEINTFGEGGGVFSDPSRTDTAIKGYDPVAYFKAGKPVKGLDSFTTQWKGAKWKFSSKENLDLFVASPLKYAPQYGGYCAYGVARGYAVKTEPDQWAIVDDKLYLNYDEGVSKKWKKERAKFIQEADKKFPEVVKGI